MISPRKKRDDLRAVTPDWLQSTHHILVQAHEHQTKSTALRDASASLKASTDKELREKTNGVNVLLKEKVAETATIKSKLEKELRDIVNEMSTLEDTKQAVRRALEDRQTPLRVAEKRIGVRRQRPQREAINDAVERALLSEAQELKITCQQLQAGVTAAEEHNAKLDRCKRQLQADINDKEMSIRLDQECLSVAPAVSPQKRAANGNNGAVLGGPINLSPKRSNLVPEQWRGGSQRLLETSDELRTQNQKLCKALRKLVKDLENNNQKSAETVSMALKNKVKQTVKLQNDLNNRLIDISQEISHLTEQKRSIENALEAKQAPLDVLRQRLNIRKQRPSRETVRDKVEEAMESELSKLSHSVNDLDKKLKTINHTLNELHNNKRQIEDDLTDKSVALQLDQQCLDFDPDTISLRTNRLATSPKWNNTQQFSPTKLPSVPGTPRSQLSRASERSRIIVD